MVRHLNKKRKEKKSIRKKSGKKYTGQFTLHDAINLSTANVFFPQMEDAGNVTTATLTIEVDMDFDGVTLACIAVNPAMPHARLTDSVKLEVHCKWGPFSSSFVIELREYVGVYY